MEKFQVKSLRHAVAVQGHVQNYSTVLKRPLC